jgi:hypoxanthine-DNA glycosylase
MELALSIRPGKAQRLVGLPPLVCANTRLLILGSFPGAASLAAQRYYGHPQNQFWPVLRAIFASSHCPAYMSSYEKNSNWLLRQGVGVWDVYASCERAGSLDSAIRNAEVNDFASLIQRCPHLKAIAHNGSESFKHARYVTASLSAARVPQGAKAPLVGSATPLPVYKLPSTSPANASWSFDRKLAAWREVMAAQGLVA